MREGDCKRTAKLFTVIFYGLRIFCCKKAYARPGRMRAAWTYFASWPQLAKDFAQLSQTKLTMPVLSIGGEKSLGNQLGAQMKLVADNVTVIVLSNTGHWILEEKPKETSDAPVKFL